MRCPFGLYAYAKVYDDCISGHKKREENNVPMREKSNNKQHDVYDVSPNTPEADESG